MTNDSLGICAELHVVLEDFADEDENDYVANYDDSLLSDEDEQGPDAGGGGGGDDDGDV